MKALIYLTRRSFINNLKKAVRKPSTLIALIFGVVYGVYIVVMLGTLAALIRLDSVRGLVIIVTLWSIYMTLGNFMGYSSRKGIIFRPAHAHFVFPAPFSPKLVLVNCAWMNYMMSVIIWIVLAIGGMTVFQVPAWKVLLFFMSGCVLELLFEVSVMVFLYTNDHLPQGLMKGIRTFIKLVLVAFTLLIILYFRRNGLSVESASAFIDWPVLQMIPVIGWQIAVYRLILLGPTTLNMICSVLYIVMALGCIAAASRMKCDGGYYEEAAKFANDYAEIRKRQKDGELVTGIGAKKRFRRLKSEKEQYSGSRAGKKALGAKAIFFRQLQEYKKERFFIFSKMTLVSVACAFIFSYALREAAMETGNPSLFLLGVVAYVSLVMSGYLGKWENELKNPYLYLIPDTAVKKLWYATLMEHVKAFTDGCIICIPVGIFWHISVVNIVYCILIYTVIEANRLYTKVIVQSLLGEVFGRKGQDLLRVLLQMLVLGMGAGAAVLIGIFLNPDFVFPILLIYSIMVTVAMALLASLRFETMEQLV